jgi:hypothetical protein
MKLLVPAFLLAATIVAVAPGHAEDAMLKNPDQMKFAPVDGIPGATLAVAAGDPSKVGPFVMEMRWSEGSKIGPHWHTETERVTILSGTGLIGMGDTMDLAKGATFAAGGYAEMPGKMHHWFAAKTPVVMLIEGNGPFDVNLVNPEDDPSKKNVSK